jgi:hypothetical protein
MDIVLMLSYILQQAAEYFNENFTVSFLHDEAARSVIKFSNYNGTK